MNFKMQSGRSMVEMLGVLAVVGVLSIGGIAGYKYGMDKYRANETINELTIRAMGLMNQINRGEIVELNMEMGDKTKLGYDVDAWISESNPRYFYIAIANIPSSICRQILKQKWTLPTNIYGWEDPNSNLGLNEKDACGEEDITKQIDFEFYRDFAISGDGEGEAIITMPLGTCSADKPLASVDGCYDCDEPGGVYVGNGSCQSVCSNRRLSSGGYCALACGEGVNAGKPLMNYYGNCHACNASAIIYVGDDGACESVCGDLRYKEGSNCKLKK